MHEPVTEAYHLDGVQPSVRAFYYTIKDYLQAFNPNVATNVQRYYIALKFRRNVAIFQFTKRKLNVVVMAEEQHIRKRIKHYEVRSLKDSVQKFYGGPCATVIIDNDKHLTEVANVLKPLVAP